MQLCVRKPVAVNRGHSFFMNYRVEGPGRGIECIAESNMKRGYSDDDIKQISETFRRQSKKTASFFTVEAIRLSRDVSPRSPENAEPFADQLHLPG